VNRTDRHSPPCRACPSRQNEVSECKSSFFAGEVFPIAIEAGMLTHLTRLTRLRTRRDLQLPNDPAALPSAGGSLRVLELASDAGGYDRHFQPKACLEALLRVAPGLEALDVGESSLTPADAARLAAALPRDIARLHIKTYTGRMWSALPVTSLELEGQPPEDLALLAAATRLERLSLSSFVGVEPAALAAALQALPRLRALQVGNDWRRAFEPVVSVYASAPQAAAARAAAPTAEAVDAFVAAVAGLPALRELSLTGFHIRGEAEAALLEAAPRLSALRLSVCDLWAAAASELAARLRAAAGRGALSAEVRTWGSRRR
jgi:hypothetical protein